MGHVTWPRPFLGWFVIHPWARSCYDQHTYKIWSPYFPWLRRNERRYMLPEIITSSAGTVAKYCN